MQPVSKKGESQQPH